MRAVRRFGLTVVAVTLGGLGLASCVADAAPVMGTAVAGDRAATVSWSTPIGDTGATVIGYRVTPSVGSVSQTPIVFWSATTTQSVTGLSNGTTYTFTVTALQSYGDSAPSASSNPVTPGSPAALGAGAESSCALVVEGVKCWGSNQLGQLGDGTGIDSMAPRTALGLAGASALTSGAYHSCALLAGGSVKCWGQNHLGQLGYGMTSTRRATPVAVSGVTGAVSISASQSQGDAYGNRRDDHTCAALATGEVRCWGGNLHGQLGSGNTASSATPATVGGLTDATAVASGGSHTCALQGDGGVTCWGDNEFGQLGNDVECSVPVEIEPCQSLVPVPVSGITDATAIAAGWRDTCAVLSDGAITCWGWTAVTWGSDSPAPPPPSYRVPRVVVGVTEATSVSVGTEHACAADRHGTATCWGAWVLGEMPTWPGPRVPAGPTAVTTGVTAVSVGVGHACAVADGAVECWGDNYFGQLGDGLKSSSTPVAVAVPGVTETVAITAGGRASEEDGGHSCSLGAGGTIQCWGGNSSGELGRGTLTHSEPPGAVAGITDATAVATSEDHSCAVVGGGGVVCWGDNYFGQLGDGSTARSSVPVSVVGLTGVMAVATGYRFSCALMADGTVACWGEGGSGALGNGATADSMVPVGVAGLTSATALTASGGHTCALVTGGGVECWGSNPEGVLGDGTTNSASVPVSVQGLTPASAVVTGGLHTCAIVAGGEVRCWGWNRYGQLGNGTVTSSLVPVAVTGVTGATALGSGAWHSCAVVADGAVACWGRNDRGSLGNGTYAGSTTPVPASGVSGATALAAGYSHTCAARTDGTVECWGDNSSGEVGIPLTWGSPTPTLVIGL